MLRINSYFLNRRVTVAISAAVPPAVAFWDARDLSIGERLSMTKQEIFEVIKRNILEVLPDADAKRIVPEISMRDLGANSIDRADILIQSMESFRLKFPLHELGSVKNLQGLVDFLHAKMNPQPGA